MNLKVLSILGTIFVCLVHFSSARMLPTRSNDDSLDRLRDLLRDILDSDSDLHKPVQAAEKRSDARELSPEDYRDIKDMISQKTYGSLVSDRYLAYKPRGLPLRSLYGTKLSLAATDEKK